MDVIQNPPLILTPVLVFGMEHEHGGESMGYAGVVYQEIRAASDLALQHHGR